MFPPSDAADSLSRNRPRRPGDSLDKDTVGEEILRKMKVRLGSPFHFLTRSARIVAT